MKAALFPHTRASMWSTAGSSLPAKRGAAPHAICGGVVGRHLPGAPTLVWPPSPDETSAVFRKVSLSGSAGGARNVAGLLDPTGYMWHTGHK